MPERQHNKTTGFSSCLNDNTIKPLASHHVWTKTQCNHCFFQHFNHFIQALCQSTLSTHFIKTLYQSTLSKHFMKTFYESILSKHFIQTLYQITLSNHFIQTLHESILWKHFIQTLYPNTLSNHFIQALYQAIPKSMLQILIIHLCTTYLSGEVFRSITCYKVLLGIFHSQALYSPINHLVNKRRTTLDNTSANPGTTFGPGQCPLPSRAI